MNKFIVSLMLAIFSCLQLMATHQAPTETGYQMILQLNNGEEVHFALKDQPVISFQGQELHISTSNNDYHTPLYNVKNYQFKMIQTGIHSTLNNNFQTQITAQTIKIKGLHAQAKVSLFRINGQLVKNMTANTQGELEMQLSDLQQGVYVLKTPQNTIKFIHQ